MKSEIRMTKFETNTNDRRKIFDKSENLNIEIRNKYK